MKKYECVWDYPRPPRIEKCNKKILTRIGKLVLVCSDGAYRVLETSHPPCFYIPQRDIKMKYLIKNEKHTFCEFKGKADYWDFQSDKISIRNIAWSYQDPVKKFTHLKGYLSFYASSQHEAWVGDEKVLAQESSFYGGWITPFIKGPFKGPRGTERW